MVRHYGNGILNSFINNLLFELHSPGYNYLGPGTNLHLKEEKGISPINKLDEAAKEHDIAYSKSKDLPERHKADKILEEKGLKRVFEKDASLNEKMNAYLTTNAMKVKRKLGMGQCNRYKEVVLLRTNRLLSAILKSKKKQL
jgi:Phospholipase A2-like domain